MEKSWKEIKNAKHIPPQDFPQEWVQTQFPETDFIEFLVQNNKQSCKLATYRFPSVVQPPRAVVIALHGLHSYANKFAYYGSRLSQQGIETVGYDGRGHGNSQGNRGIIQSVQTLVDDAALFYQKIRNIYPQDIKIFCMGMSLGGHITLKLEMQYSNFFSGLILICPAISSIPDLKAP